MANRFASQTGTEGYRAFIKEATVQDVSLSDGERMSMCFFLYPLGTLELLEEKRESTDSDVFFTLAVSSYLGLFTEKDDKKAFKYFDLLASEYQSPIAKLIRANFYLLGIGVERDVTKAFETYRDMRHDKFALYNYAYCKELGIGTEKDELEAFGLYKKLCKSGRFPLAANRLANCYYYGIGTEQNLFVARNYYEDAAEACHPQALLMLGHMHYFGIECIPDAEEAFEYLHKANETDSNFTFYETLNIRDVSFGYAINIDFPYLRKLSDDYPNNDWYSMLLCDRYIKKDDYERAKPLLEKLIRNEYCEIKYIYYDLMSKGAYSDPYGDHLLELAKLAYVHYHNGAMSYLSSRYFEYVTRVGFTDGEKAKDEDKDIPTLLVLDKERYMRDCTLAAFEKLSGHTEGNLFVFPWVIYERACIRYFGLGVEADKIKALEDIGEFYDQDYYKSGLMSALLAWNRLKDGINLSEIGLAKEHLERLRLSAESMEFDAIKILYINFANDFNSISKPSDKITGELTMKTAESIRNKKLRYFMMALCAEKRGVRPGKAKRTGDGRVGAGDNSGTGIDYEEICGLYINCIREIAPPVLSANTGDVCDNAIIDALVSYLEGRCYHKYRDIDSLCFYRLGELYLYAGYDYNNSSRYYRLAADDAEFPYKDKALFELLRTMCVRRRFFSAENIEYVFASAKLANGEFTDGDMRRLGRNNSDIYHILRFYFDTWRDRNKSVLFQELLNHKNSVALFLNNLGDIDNAEFANFYFDENGEQSIFQKEPKIHFQTIVYAAKNMMFEYAVNLETGVGVTADKPRATDYFKAMKETDIRAGLRLADIYCGQNRIGDAVKIYRDYTDRNVPEAFIKLAGLAKSGKTRDFSDDSITRLRIRASMLKNKYSEK